MKYHVSINSIYIKLDKLRYRGAGYSTYSVSYYSKASGILLLSEKSVRIKDEAIKSWEVWEG
jgi:hypothetical protein